MKKLLLIASVLVGLTLSAQNFTQEIATSRPMPDSRETPGVKPLSVSAEKFEINTPALKRNVKATPLAAINATESDFIGEWAWKGGNLLSSVVLPNEGLLLIEPNPTNPSRLVVRMPVSDVELDAYVKDGKLYIPNQNVAPCASIQDRSDVWFVNYTFTKAEQEGYVNLVRAQNQEFYFQINSDGTITAGIPSIDLDEFSMTDADFERLVCIGTLLVEEGYYWFCRYIEGDKAFLKEGGITYHIDKYSDIAAVVGCDFNVESAHIAESIAWDGKAYPVTEIRTNAFRNHANLAHVELPGTITDIFETAFANCVCLQSMVIPNSVKRIYDYAFSNCSSLETCTLGNSLEFLGYSVFMDCASLKHIKLPDSLKTMQTTFRYCTGLESISIGNGLTEISDYCFVVCQKLKKVEFGTSIERIGYAAFNQCTALENIDLPNSLKTIDNWAFSDCFSLKSVELPASLESFAPSMFGYCRNLQSIAVAAGNKDFVSKDGVVYSKDGSNLLLFPAGRREVSNAFEGISEIGESAFNGNIRIQEIVIPENVKRLAEGTFINCTNLRDLRIPETVDTIPMQFLAGAFSLGSLKLPESIESIGYLAFEACRTLTTIEMGENVTEIKEGAFWDCYGLDAIYCHSLTPPVITADAFDEGAVGSIKLYVPEAAIASYLDAPVWSLFASINRLGGSLTLSDTEVTLSEKEVYQLGVYGSSDKVTWSSSNAEVAYANECGLIVGRKAGSTTVTATSNGLSATCNVTIVSSQTRAGMHAEDGATEPTAMVIESVGGDPMMVNLRLIPVGSRTVIDWSTSDSAIATVEDGLVILEGEGDITFTAESSNGIAGEFETETDEITNAHVVSVGEMPESNDIYTLQGVCIKRQATEKDIEALPAGLYIIGHRKVLKK